MPQDCIRYTLSVEPDVLLAAAADAATAIVFDAAVAVEVVESVFWQAANMRLADRTYIALDNEMFVFIKLLLLFLINKK